MLPTPMMTAMDRTVTIRHKKAMQITAPKGAMTRKTAMTTMGDEATESEEGLVALTQQQIEASGIQVVAVGRGGGSETRLSGRVEPAIGARAAVAASIGGRVERVIVAPGTRVRVGQPLAVIVSGEAATMRANADAARAEAEAARLVYQRDQALVTQGVVAKQELEASRARSLSAEAAARAAAAQVVAAGFAERRWARDHYQLGTRRGRRGPGDARRLRRRG